jgi:EAL domain-containing protein (putative c-di-GMP-specific phosphodiesterase class I)/PAS domain-containing protein
MDFGTMEALVASKSNIAADRNRFLKLAFCRADLLFELDRARRIVFSAGATGQLFGVIEDRLVGTPFADLIADEDREAVDRRLAEVSTDGRVNDSPVRLKAVKDRRILAVLAGYRTREFEDHYFLAVKIVLGDESVQPTMDDDALADEQAFGQIAAQRIHQLSARGETAKVSLIRLRKFKELAEKLGKSERCSLFAAISRVLRRHAIGGDTAGQIDSESFGLVHGAGVDPERITREIEEAAQTALPPDVSLEAHAVTLDASGAGLTEDQMARALVHSMHQFCSRNAKLTVRSLTEALDELANGTVETVKYFQDISRSGDFDLVFMPICDLRLGKVHHFEALSRFRDDARTKSTFQMIALAENLNLIAGFDMAVVSKAIDQVVAFNARKPLPSVAVNLSAVSLASDVFIQKLHKLLDRTQGLNRRIMFEMTESAEIAELPRINKVIQSLRGKGYRFSLDDFGAGSASFDYLNAFDVDLVKFDGPVVRRACSSKRGHDLLSTMARMCVSSGLQTVAEMVEDKAIANQVFYCGIDYGQGWYFGKPTANPFEFEANFTGVG